jgi:hypothetical protein
MSIREVDPMEETVQLSGEELEELLRAAPEVAAETTAEPPQTRG